MLYKIEHITTYKYSKEVFLEPHTVRLRPRTDSAQTLKNFEIIVSPKPTGHTNLIDSGGDSVFMWFEDMTDSLEIVCRSEVETKRANSFDYILASDRAARLPMEYSKPYKSALEQYRAPSTDFGGYF